MLSRPAKAGLAAAAVALVAAATGVSFAVGVNQSAIVNVTPSSATPNINDGNVYAITQVGTRIIVGGDFTNANPPGDTTTSHKVTRHDLLAFDATTGAIDTGFVPAIDGQVRALLPGPTADTVYVGGGFSHLNTAKVGGLILISTATGKAVSGFTPPSTDAMVWALSLAGSHLILGGQFTKLGGASHAGIGAVDPNTGALQGSFLTAQVAGHHNYTSGSGNANGAVGVHEMDVTPDGTHLVAVGNFKTVGGVTHDQIVMFNVSATAATVNTAWNTSSFTASCNPKSFDTYMRGVSFSPDGSYFAVVATGGGGGGKNTDKTKALCDSASRWSTTATGANVLPTWVDWSGNDSFESVTITGAAIYVGGHFRWLNNSSCSDCPGPGAVPRPGIAALNPQNGISFAWNPGRNPRGAGAYWLYATDQGLYIGGDTDAVGTGKSYFVRKRVSFFPLTSSGEIIPATPPQALPATIFQAGEVSGVDTDLLQSRTFDGTTASGLTSSASHTIAWSKVRGAFMANGRIFYGYSDGKLYQAGFDGTTVGTPSAVDPYDDPTWSDVQTGSGQTYRGTPPALYGTTMNTITGMILANGRLYYTRAGTTGLRYRYFNVDDGVLGSDEFFGGGDVNFTNIAGMFFDGATLYYADKATGNLHAVPWNSGSPAKASDKVISGPSIDGKDWRARGIFAMPTPAAPTPPPTPSAPAPSAPAPSDSAPTP